MTCDNASNNATFLRALESSAISSGFLFDARKNHVRCIAHVMNLAVQAILTAIKTDIPEDGEVLSEDIEDDGDVGYTGQIVNKAS